MSAWISFSQAQEKISKLVSGDAGEKKAITTRTVTEIPPPLEKCLAAPPQKLQEAAVARQQEAIARGIEEKESGWKAATSSENKALDRAAGALTAAKGFAEKTFGEAKVYTAKSIREASFNRDLSLFLEEFGELVRTGPTALLSCHEGYVMSEGEPSLVDVFVTSSHLCISGRALREAIPLRDIHAIYPSVELATTSLTPYFMHLPDPEVRPTAVQIYTSGGNVYQLLRFAQSVRHAAANTSVNNYTAALTFYAALDDAWRMLLGTAAEGTTSAGDVSEAL